MKMLPFCLTGLALLGFAAATPASAGYVVGSAKVTVGPFVGYFSVTSDADTNLCLDCKVTQDGSKLGITITRPTQANGGNLVDARDPNFISEQTLTISAYVTQGGIPVPILGGIYTVTGGGEGFGLAGTNPQDPNSNSIGFITPEGPGPTTETFFFTSAYTATPRLPYNNSPDLTAGVPGIDAGFISSFSEDLIVGVPEPASAALVLAGFAGLLAGRARRKARAA